LRCPCLIFFSRHPDDLDLFIGGLSERPGNSFIGRVNQSTRRKPPTYHESLANYITWCCIEYTSPWTGFELTTLVVIGTVCTFSCKSNYQTITTMMGYKSVGSGR
jgi:hypothetical protein